VQSASTHLSKVTQSLQSAAYRDAPKGAPAQPHKETIYQSRSNEGHPVAEYEDSSLHKHETSTYGATTRDIYRIIVCGCKKTLWGKP
jgi:hypothetical protein